MKIITVTLAPNQAVLTCYLQDQSPKMPNAAIRPAMLVVPGAATSIALTVRANRLPGLYGTGVQCVCSALYGRCNHPD